MDIKLIKTPIEAISFVAIQLLILIAVLSIFF